MRSSALLLTPFASPARVTQNWSPVSPRRWGTGPGLQGFRLRGNLREKGTLIA